MPNNKAMMNLSKVFKKKKILLKNALKQKMKPDYGGGENLYYNPNTYI
jgi:hypothetical protein